MIQTRSIVSIDFLSFSIVQIEMAEMFHYVDSVITLMENDRTNIKKWVPSEKQTDQ